MAPHRRFVLRGVGCVEQMRLSRLRGDQHDKCCRDCERRLVGAHVENVKQPTQGRLLLRGTGARGHRIWTSFVSEAHLPPPPANGEEAWSLRSTSNCDSPI